MNQKLEYWFLSCYQQIMKNKADGKATILTYHKVSDELTPFELEEVGRQEFFHKMKLLKSFFHVMPLPELLAATRNNDIPDYAVAITIDDGYADCYSVITPILDDLGISGTFFISTEGIKSGGLWNDKIAFSFMNTRKQRVNLPSFGQHSIGDLQEKKELYQKVLMRCKYMSSVDREDYLSELFKELDVEYNEQNFLTEDQIKKINTAGMSIGAHTHSHPILSCEADSVAYKDIWQSKDDLENILKEPIKYFAYPNGLQNKDFDSRHIKMVRELGFEAAFSTNWGHLEKTTNYFAIPRFTPWDKGEYRFFLRLVNHFTKNFR